MSQQGIDGSFVISADGTSKVCSQPFPECGTVTIALTLTGWTGNILPTLVGRGEPAGTAGTNTIYQRASLNTDVAAGTYMSTTDKYYFRLDGTRLELVTTGYGGGTATVAWSWSRG